ncbi:unnamed protein product [Rhizoctonia solani]|uniref:Uncharacterized protein n=1 Tax=Rhizoctonia solani TaxID=456999 RepID=A0A8H3DAG9_9AGAM|nr:unnamed protein product [Rhizoctonia solani]
MSSSSHSPAPESMTRTTTAADTPAALTPSSSAAELPNLGEMAITTLVEDVDATRRMARLNFLLERSSLYARILETRITDDTVGNPRTETQGLSKSPVPGELFRPKNGALNGTVGTAAGISKGAGGTPAGALLFESTSGTAIGELNALASSSYSKQP